MAEQDARTLVGYRVDQTSVQTAVDANNRVAASYASISSAVASIGSEVLALNPGLAAQATSAGAVTDQLRTQLPIAERLAEAARARESAETGFLAQLRQEAFAAPAGGAGAGAGGGGGVGRTISRISRGLFNLPDVQITPGLSSTTASRLGLVAGGAASAIGLTTAGLVALGAAAVPVVLAIKAITDAEAARGEAAKKTAAQILDISEQIAGGATSRDIREQIAQQQRQKEGLEEGRKLLEGYQERFAAVNQSYEQGYASADEYKTILTNLNAELYDATGGTLGLKDGLGQAVVVAGNFNGVLAENQTQIDDVNAKIAANTIALQTQGIATNDATAALQRQTDAQLEAVNRDLEISKMTSEQRQQRIADAQQEIAFLQMQIYNTDLTADASEALSIRIGELNKDIQAVASVTSTYADYLEQERKNKELITDQYDNYLEALDTEAKIRDEIAETIAKINDIIAERDARIAEIVADGEERRGEIQRDAAERRAEIENDARERLEQITRDSAERIAKIMRDAGREQFAAVASREALAFYQSQIRAKDQLDDEAASQKKQIDNLTRSLAKQEAALDKSLQKQLDTQAKAQQKQIDNVVQSSNKQIEVQQQGLTRLNVDLQNAVNAQIAIAQNGSGGLVNIHNNMWSNLNTLTNNWATTIVNNIASKLQGVPGGVGGAVGGLPGVGGQATFNRLFDNRLNQTLRAGYS